MVPTSTSCCVLAAALELQVDGVGIVGKQNTCKQTEDLQ